MRGRRPLATPFFLSASPESSCGAGSPSTHQWAYPAHTRGSFRFTTKGTKGVPGLRPWTPLGGIIIPPTAHAPFPPEGLSHWASGEVWACASLRAG